MQPLSGKTHYTSSSSSPPGLCSRRFQPPKISAFSTRQVIITAFLILVLCALRLNFSPHVRGLPSKDHDTCFAPHTDVLGALSGTAGTRSKSGYNHITSPEVLQDGMGVDIRDGGSSRRWIGHPSTVDLALSTLPAAVLILVIDELPPRVNSKTANGEVFHAITYG
ncbi:hypothetical protein FN846DRAFT_471206 [Sphaerosporella brunnea]|uniref:Uncharacterized protein n=1 Tax=Sphaerosporella brunnea TaxID=1250544 RepID=A0A5J5EF37_9PEZI|nr:hypothetical protein FN846DRAFT_471206 [Sphaerosporella brunnea]